MNSSSTPIDWQSALDQHCSWLRKVLRCRVADTHAVEDLMQETALAVFRQVKTNPSAVPDQPERVAPWLYRITVRQAINYYRRRGRKSAAKTVENLDQFDTAAQPLDWLVTRELHQSVRDSLDRLPARDRELLVLKYSENWSYRELAEHLGVRTRTVEYRLMKAREKLRKLLSTSTLRGAK